MIRVGMKSWLLQNYNYSPKNMSKQNSEIPPKDWAPTQAVEDPIINNPYKEPTNYWLYKGGVPSKISGRRPASYFYKTKRVGALEEEMELFQEESSEELFLVNALRKDVKRWREAGYRGATQVTKELLAWWTREDRPRRLFFCQQEAVETIIYLLELAIPDRLRATGFQSFELSVENLKLMLKGEKPNFNLVSEDFYPRLVDAPWDDKLIPLRRMACKMATGSGKTIVMAMINTWAFCNRSRNPSSTQFPSAVLICAPNLTVKKRLRVLNPEDPNNYYDAFDLVPPKYREALATGKVLVTNWHVFAPKSEHSEGGKSYAVVDKGEETSEAFTLDRLGELAHRLPLLVLNDEGHHCWRGKNLTEAEERQLLRGKSTEEKNALEEEENEARVWLAGLDKINNSALNTPGVAGIYACIDLSATPFHLSNSGFPEGSPFPWIVSDFGLVDAIESGITKVPRLPVKDDLNRKDEAGRPDPRYFKLWEHIKGDLREGDYIRKGQPKPEAIYKYAEGALQTLAGQWKLQFEKYKIDAAGKPFTPPVLIVVCDNTEISEVFYRKICGEYEGESVDAEGNTIKITNYSGSAVLPELSNTQNVQHTIRIDSKLLNALEAENGQSKDVRIARLRELIDTVGKRGTIGEQVRCVVSVSMLTEGWDASNVTHVLGIRAFGSQLLCEQVVGRGLRRMSYNPDPTTGLLPAEYVDVYGIPFSLIPFKGKAKESDTADPVYHPVYAIPERANYEIRMPNVESYVYALKEAGISCNVSELEGFVVNKEPFKVVLAPTRGYQDDTASRQDVGDFIEQTREEYYRAVRPQQIIFRLSQIILDDLLKGAQAAPGKEGKLKHLARHQLFPEILRIVEEYVRTKVTFKPGVDVRELGLERYANLLRERVRDGILPMVSSEEAKLLPVQNSFQPFTTTSNVNYQTTRPVADLVKSHLNRVVLRSNWEKRAVEVMERVDCVECFAPNDDKIGLIVPYEYESQRHSYQPDFVVRLQNKKMVMLEVKGIAGRIHNEDQVLAKNAAAKKWVTAINNSTKWGEWAFEMCEDLGKLRKLLETHAGIVEEVRPFRFVTPDLSIAWKTCVPLTTLHATAGQFSVDQPELDKFGEWSEDWITWEKAPAFEKGMFVAKVSGDSMLPLIPNGAYCLFRQPRDGSRNGKVLLVWHSGITDPHTGGQFTVKVYESEKKAAEEGGWEHVQITLKPKNPEFEPIVLTPEEEGQVMVIAEFVSVIG